MSNLRRSGPVLGLALLVALTACTGSADPDPGSSASAPVTFGDDSDALGGTTASPSCDDVRAETPAGATVGSAISANPLLGQLSRALSAIGYRTTLDSPAAGYTVLAPTDAAFAALPAGRLDELLAQPTGDLVAILTYHVVATRYDAAGLVAAGTVTTVEGEDLTITGTAAAPVVDGVPVQCADIPASNGTLFTVGSLLPLPGA